MFRATPEMCELFKIPFAARWVFDVELLARLIQSQADSGSSGLGSAVLELPLAQWKDVDGSKLRMRDAIRGFLDLLLIRKKYPINRDQG